MSRAPRVRNPTTHNSISVAAGLADIAGLSYPWGLSSDMGQLIGKFTCQIMFLLKVRIVFFSSVTSVIDLLRIVYVTDRHRVCW